MHRPQLAKASHCHGSEWHVCMSGYCLATEICCSYKQALSAGLQQQLNDLYSWLCLKASAKSTPSCCSMEWPAARHSRQGMSQLLPQSYALPQPRQVRLMHVPERTGAAPQRAARERAQAACCELQGGSGAGGAPCAQVQGRAA